MIDIDLTGSVAPRHEEMVRALKQVPNWLNSDRWCVVGGFMVLIAGVAAGGRPPGRGTKDGDVVVDVVAEPTLLARLVHGLEQFGFKPADPVGGERAARCTFHCPPAAVIDVLAPDDAPAGALSIGTGLATLAIPGGRHALEHAQWVDVHWGDDGLASLRVPLLHDALIVKASAATDPRTSGQLRHLQDIAYLLSVAPDPVMLRDSISPAHRALVVRLADRLSASTGAFDFIDLADRSIVKAALDFLRE